MDELPVSQIRVFIRQPNGADDLELLERMGQGKRAALALITQLVSLSGGESYDWGSLTITDFQTLLLLLRRAAFGEEIRSQIVCEAEGCHARVEIWFRICDYLTHQTPRRPAGVELAGEPGWFLMKGLGTIFRLPTVADLMAISEGTTSCGKSEQSIRQNLASRLLRPLTYPVGTVQRIEAAMAAMAPDLCGNLSGTCPDCQRKVFVYFDVEQFVVREFRDQAAFIYQDVHLLASRYRWAEQAILDLPRNRRVLYSEILKQEGGLA